MTLGELKRDLRKHGIRVIGSVVVRPIGGNETVKAVTYFSRDQQIVYPHKPPGEIYPLVTSTTSDDEVVHSEKIKSLKRSLILDWDEE
jgi:hypothetical protein